VLLRDGRDNEGRVKASKGIAQGSELGVSAAHLKILLHIIN
jgi:hypothetical protein